MHFTQTHIVFLSVNEVNNDRRKGVLSVFEDLEELGEAESDLGPEPRKCKNAVGFFVVAPQIERWITHYFRIKIRVTDDNVSGDASDGNNGKHDQQFGSDADVLEDRHRAF